MQQKVVKYYWETIFFKTAEWIELKVGGKTELGKYNFVANSVFVCLCWGFTAQSTQWGHVERGQFT